MFYYISGKLAHLESNVAVIDAGGVGYKMTISGTTYDALAALRASNESTAQLYTHMAVREDDVELFGFATEAELSTFKLLITVSGIGPKAATSILSTFTPEKFALAVCSEDQKAISRANGIGAKTAARVILELKDKLMKEKNAEGIGVKLSGSDLAPAVNRGKLNEAVDALMVLGYSKPEAIAAIKDLDLERMDLETVIRQALKRMMH